MSTQRRPRGWDRAVTILAVVAGLVGMHVLGGGTAGMAMHHRSAVAADQMSALSALSALSGTVVPGPARNADPSSAPATSPDRHEHLTHVCLLALAGAIVLLLVVLGILRRGLSHSIWPAAAPPVPRAPPRTAPVPFDPSIYDLCVQRQ